MHANGMRRNRFQDRKSRRVRGEVLVVPSNLVPGVGLIREDFILVIITLQLLLRFGQDWCSTKPLVTCRQSC